MSIKCPGYFDVQPLAEEFHDLRCKIGMSKNSRSAACVQRVWGRSNHNCVGCTYLLYTLVVLPMMFCISRCLCTKDVPCNWAPHWSHVTVKEFLRWITSFISYADDMYIKLNIFICPTLISLHTHTLEYRMRYLKLKKTTGTYSSKSFLP